MNRQEILSKCDHTILKPEAVWEDVRKICDEAMQYHTASICIPPCYVKRAAEYCDGRMPVCTVIGFPHGNEASIVKAFEARNAIADGADEIDMVINIGMLKMKDREGLKQEISLLREACGDKILKVIIETCLLTEEEKIMMCEIVTECGADFIKTSTGFSTGGATFEDVALFKKYVGPNVRIKAAGGIASFEDAEKMVELGADRLGTSRLVKIMQAEQA
ncbi:MAG: deoxyribose-phosphate aldolase [Lachnospiraceae bacterium]|nr:deoxyribose-phosphate aldolase [Lachnospiraceae bacterium]